MDAYKASANLVDDHFAEVCKLVQIRSGKVAYEKSIG